MPNYMLLLRGCPKSHDLSPEEMQKIIEKYSAWRQGLADAGRLVGSEKLTDGEGRVLRRKNGGVRVLDGPYSETKEVIGGYFAIHAADYDQAVEIARGCPHLDYGSVELREIEEVH